MPVRDLIFAFFPAEENGRFSLLREEIDQSLIEILQLGSGCMKLAHRLFKFPGLLFLQPGQPLHLFLGLGADQLLHCFLFFQFQDFVAVLPQKDQPFPHPREKFVGFVQRDQEMNSSWTLRGVRPASAASSRRSCIAFAPSGRQSTAQRLTYIPTNRSVSA